MSENETPKDEELKDDVSAEHGPEAVDGDDQVSDQFDNSEASGADQLEEADDVGVATADATLAEAIHLADELVKTRIEKIHEAGERSVSQAVQSMEALMGSVLDSAEAATKASATANVSTGNLVKAARKLDDASHRSSKISTVVLVCWWSDAIYFCRSVWLYGCAAIETISRT